MGEAASESGPNRRSKVASTAFTVIGLLFFFAVGLAGGAAYKIYFNDDAAPQAAGRVSSPTAAAPAPPAENFAASAVSVGEKAAPDPTPVKSDAPPLLALQPAPAEATEPPAARQPAAPPATLPEPAPQAAPSEPLADASTTEIAPPPPEAQPETPRTAAAATLAATPAQRPAAPAKAHRGAPPQKPRPQIAALRPPPATRGGASGPYRVQFGAFAHEDNARRLQWAIEAAGLKVDISQERGPSGRSLFFVRSPTYPDYSSALTAAQTVRDRAEHFANAVSIDYAILGNHLAPE